MTEEEFKKTMTKVVIFVVIALIVLVVIGIIVFGTSKKENSIFESQAEIDNYKRNVERINSHQITEEDMEELENSEEFEENEASETGEEATEEGTEDE
jgi:Sec-independent protein translocase protein TatA